MGNWRVAPTSLNHCPECRFQNPAHYEQCLMCKTPLSPAPAESPLSEEPVESPLSEAAPVESPLSEAAPVESPPAQKPGLQGLSDRAIWLYCPPHDPIFLKDGGELRVGRKGADLNLPHKHVSRKHLVIRRRGDQVEIEDLGSSNGSYLNEHRLEAATPFRSGDILEVGPFELTLSLGSSELSEDFDPGSTQAAAAWTGDLEEVPLGEVFQNIEFNQKTGTLEIRSSGHSARLRVIAGQVISAKFNKLRGSEAALEMLQLETGRFLFQPSSRLTGSPLPFSLTSLLLEFARVVDEGC
jgi:uncharacterized protein DUF4388/FHA domain-containing protein